MKITTTATFTASTTSAAVDLGEAVLAAVITPSAWSTGTLRVQGSADGSTFTDIKDADGDVASFSAVPASAAYSVDISALLPYRYVRLVSSVTQTCAVTLIARQFA